MTPKPFLFCSGSGYVADAAPNYKSSCFRLSGAGIIGKQHVSPELPPTLFNHASVFPVVRIVHGAERRGLILSFSFLP